MAIKRMMIDGYGQIELNQVAFRRDGRIEAQCALNPVDFEKVSAENGMLLAVDNANRTINFPVEGSDLPIALNYTTEHMYDERHQALRNFKLDIVDGFYPRLGFLAVGDKYTTNCIAFDDGEFANEDAVEAAAEACAETALYAIPCENGAHLVTAAKPEAGVALKAIKATTMPDGQFAIKFQVIGC